jgi:diketogulonate reductase-like aldo/keto reductase
MAASIGNMLHSFAWTGEQLPLIGQGTWMIEQDPRPAAVSALQSGVSLGMTLIDTAEMYGNGRAEEIVGTALRGQRDGLFLVSKVLPSNASYDGTLRACEKSLRRLGVESIDLYLLHWRGQYPLRETMRAMESLVREGLVRYIGVSNFDVSDVQEAQAALSNERLACNQVLYHLGDRGIERSLIPYCDRHEIAVMGYSPFGHRDFPRAGSAGGKVLQEIAAARGVSTRAVILAFLIRNRQFAIPKSGNPAHTAENAGAAGLSLHEEEISRIDAAFPAPDRDVPLGMI